MRNKSEKMVGIFLATYNGELYIREFLDSLIAQTFKDFCIYVRDDGSTDSTLEIIAEYSLDLDICILDSENRLGPAKGFFRIMEQASDSHLCYLFADQDDYWYDNKVARAVTELQGHQDEIMLYCSRLEYVDKNLEHLELSRIPKILNFENALVENIATGCTVAITRLMRSEILASKPYDFVMHDWWLYLYATAFGRVIYDPIPSIKYRQHGGNVLGAATTFIEDFRRRFARFRKKQGGIHSLSQQAKAFMICYDEKLKINHRKIIELLVLGTESFFIRLRLFVFPPVSRQIPLDTFILRLLFLMGRY